LTAKQKYQSYIGQKAFIGSNSLIIAPRNIGDFAFIAGGSVITKDIPPKALAIERAELKILEDKSKVKDE
jgi:N-acetylglucosamine-1-phosphate uridyltransferase (contains nucleotidyltransferase and I-patch acetyltransferase domains)